MKRTIAQIKADAAKDRDAAGKAINELSRLRVDSHDCAAGCRTVSRGDAVAGAAAQNARAVVLGHGDGQDLYLRPTTPFDIPAGETVIVSRNADPARVLARCDDIEGMADLIDQLALALRFYHKGAPGTAHNAKYCHACGPLNEYERLCK